MPRELVDEAISRIERRLVSSGEKEVRTERIGQLVLGELKQLDSVAYIRFASVYFNVERPEAFAELMREVNAAEREAAQDD